RGSVLELLARDPPCDPPRDVQEREADGEGGGRRPQSEVVRHGSTQGSRHGDGPQAPPVKTNPESPHQGSQEGDPENRLQVICTTGGKASPSRKDQGAHASTLASAPRVDVRELSDKYAAACRRTRWHRSRDRGCARCASVRSCINGSRKGGFGPEPACPLSPISPPSWASRGQRSVRLCVPWRPRACCGG